LPAVIVRQHTMLRSRPPANARRDPPIDGYARWLRAFWFVTFDLSRYSRDGPYFLPAALKAFSNFEKPAGAPSLFSHPVAAGHMFR